MKQHNNLPYKGEGILINSNEFNGLTTEEAKKRILQKLEQLGVGKRKVIYRLQDWNISRQRYWGTPIPIVYCEKCGIVPIPEDELPVKLPADIDFTNNTKGNPLRNYEKFVNTTCPKCGAPAKRETDTMDTFFDSSWYYLRFIDPHNSKEPFDKSKADYWLPVDTYVGGIEHAVLHLLYARFMAKFLQDIGLIEYDEPFDRLLTQGMVLKRWVSIRRLLEHLNLDENSTIEELLQRLRAKGFLDNSCKSSK